MQIFDQEINDGLEEQLRSSASLSYACLVEPSNKTNHNIKHIKSLASLNDTDLYYVQSILVTSNWNKNDDIFDKTEVWSAKNTPEDKPTNLNHDERIIVGHITSNWPVTDDGVLIDENTPIENLPDKFHILTGSVIYRGFSSEDLMERTNKLISEIETGNKYVSMECFFKGFDYGLLNKSSGQFKVLGRNAETAFLTKYLRAYGGLGEHDNYKIGRVLRNITFSGKGFVDKPANPDSIIFNKDSVPRNSMAYTIENFVNLSNLGVSDIQPTLNVENNTMSLNETKAEVAAETNEIAQTSETVETTVTETVATQETIESLNNRISELETQVAGQLETIKLLETEKEEAAKKMKDEEETTKEEAAKKMKAEKDMEEENKKLKAELEAANEAIAGYKNKEKEMAKKEKDMKRKAALVESGLEDSIATETLAKFEALDDEAFEAITVLLAAKKPSKKVPPEDMTDERTETKVVKDKASVETADESVLDSVEVEPEVNLSVGGEIETQVDTTRAALVEFVSSRLGKK